RLGEVVVGARVDARAEQVHLAVGPSGADLAPSRDAPLRVRRPDTTQLLDGEVIHPGVVRVHDHDQAVVGDRQLGERDPRSPARVDLGRLDRAARVADVRLAAAEAGEAAAGAGDAHGHARAGMRALELLGDRFGDRVDGAGPVDADRHRLGWGPAGRGQRRGTYTAEYSRHHRPHRTPPPVSRRLRAGYTGATAGPPPR